MNPPASPASIQSSSTLSPAASAVSMMSFRLRARNVLKPCWSSMATTISSP